jgi:hypothetical protein
MALPLRLESLSDIATSDSFARDCSDFVLENFCGKFHNGSSARDRPGFAMIKRGGQGGGK